MKKISQIALALFGAVFFFVPAMHADAAVFNTASNDFPSFMVKNATVFPNSTVGWGSSVTANPGDTISFQVYYHNTDATSDAQNTGVFMSVPVGSAQNSFSATGGVGAANAAQASNSVSVTILGGVPQTLTLVPGSFRWFPDQTAVNANGIPPPNGQNENQIVAASFANGINLGTILRESNPATFTHQGNVVVQFRVSTLGGNGGGVVNAPTATNVLSQNVSCTSADLTSFLNSNGNANFTAFYEFSNNSSFSGSNSTAVQSFGNVSTQFTQTVTGLAQNSTVFFRVNTRGTNGQLNLGGTQSFNTPSCQINNNNVTVTTNPATNVQFDQATFNGVVNANGATAVTAFFEFGQNGSFPTRTSSQFFGNASTNFSFTQTGLAPNNTYNFRAVAQGNNGQLVFGNTQTFTTGGNNNCGNFCGNNNQSLPTVITNPSTSFGSSCTLSGTLINNGNNFFGSTLVYFEYGPNFTFGNRTNSQSISAGSFSSVISNLPSNTITSFRAVAQNNVGTSFGSTLTCLPNQINNNGPVSVETRPASFVSSDSAVLNGFVSLPSFSAFNNFNNQSFNNQNVTTWFEYGRTPALGNRTVSQDLGSVSSTPFSRVAVGLAPSTTYLFRAVAQTADGQIAFGNTLSLTTAPSVVTPVVIRPASTGPTGFSGVRIEKHGVNLSFPNGTQDCFAVRPGDTVEFAIVVHNVNASTAATNLTVRDTMSSFFDFVAASQGGTLQGSDVVWSVGTLAPGESRTLNFQVHIRPIAGNTTAENIARVSNGVAKELSSEKVNLILLALAGNPSTVSANGTTGFTNTNGQVVAGNEAAVASNTATTGLSTFFPQTAIGWLGLLILIVFIGILIRALV